MSLISDMRKTGGAGMVPGQCAACAGQVFESLFLLDDAYNVWVGRCPHCKALNFLALNGMRGYSSAGMELALPTDEEKASNSLPGDCPTSGPGKGPFIHGSHLGEILHKLRGGE